MGRGADSAGRPAAEAAEHVSRLHGRGRDRSSVEGWSRRGKTNGGRCLRGPFPAARLALQLTGAGNHGTNIPCRTKHDMIYHEEFESLDNDLNGMADPDGSL